MGAHRHRMVRQRHAAGIRRRCQKTADTASMEGEEDLGCGSLPDQKSAALTASAARSCRRDSSDFANGTLIRRPSASTSGRGGIDGRASGSDGVGATYDDGGWNPSPYHPEEDCAQRPGFAGRLASRHEAALGGLRQWLVRESVDLTPLVGDGSTSPPEEDDLALLRFLRHNNWDVEFTRAQLEATLSWRIEAGVATASRRDPWEVSGCASEESFQQLCRTLYPHYLLGTDRLGRPVLVQKYNNFDTSKLQEYTTLQGLLRYHAWEQERNAGLLRRASARTGYLVETYAVIMDFKGMTMGQVNRDFLWLLRELSEMDRNHYPGRGGVIYVINTPPLFGLVWQGVRAFLSTQARVHFYAKEQEWKPALVEGIDPAILPLEYGGTASPLIDTPFLPAVHRALERGVTERLAEGVAEAGKGAMTTEKQYADSLARRGNDEVAETSMSFILRCFSESGDGSGSTIERSSSFASSMSGDFGGSGGGSPVVVSRGYFGGFGIKSGGIAKGGSGGGGGGVCPAAATEGKANGGREGGGGDVALTDSPANGGVFSAINRVDNSSIRSRRDSGTTSQGPKSRSAPSGNGESTALPIRDISQRPPPSQKPASVMSLPDSDDPRAGYPSPPSFTCKADEVGRQRLGPDAGGGGESDAGGEGEGGADDECGDLEWVLNVVPGARLAATVAGAVTGTAISAALGAAGFVVGVAEAVLPEQVWAEGVQAFQSGQFAGGWVAGR